MKQLLAIIGFAPLFLASVPHALADENLPPALSPYVQATIDRSNRGIAKAEAEANVMKFLGFSKIQWLNAVGSAVSGLVNTRTLVVEQSRSLLEDTSCKRYDGILLEQQMEKVRGKLHDALDANSAMQIIILDQVLQFLEARRLVFLAGATDMDVKDETWYQKWLFDDQEQTWCCGASDACEQKSEEECQEEEGTMFGSATECSEYGCKAPPGYEQNEPPFCPFDTDYLPPNRSPFGCDAETLQLIYGRATGGKFTEFHKTLESDLLSTIILQSAIEDAQALQGEFSMSNNQIEELLGNGPLSGNGNEEHQKLSGCLSEDDRETVKNFAILTPKRGPLSIYTDHLRLLQQFQALRQRQGLDREQPDYLLPAKNEGLLLTTLSSNMAQQLRSFMASQEVDASLTFAVASDPLLSATVSYGRLTTSVYQLGQLASEMSGVRTFVKNFAFFLRSTCQNRPCNARLDEILKIVFTDECFPYNDGQFKGDSEENPRWKKCAEKAQFELR